MYYENADMKLIYYMPWKKKSPREIKRTNVEADGHSCVRLFPVDSSGNTINQSSGPRLLVCVWISDTRWHACPSRDMTYRCGTSLSPKDASFDCRLNAPWSWILLLSRAPRLTSTGSNNICSYVYWTAHAEFHVTAQCRLSPTSRLLRYYCLIMSRGEIDRKRMGLGTSVGGAGGIVGRYDYGEYIIQPYSYIYANVWVDAIIIDDSLSTGI